MGRIIRLTESELIDLIKRTINESEEVSEVDWGRVASGAAVGAAGGAYLGLGVGAIPGAIAGGLIALATAGGTGDKVLQAIKYCSSKGIGKPGMSLDQIAKIADQINGALEGLGTNEAQVGAAMRRLKYFPDFCAMARTYQQRHNESLANALDGDFDMEKDWKNYVWLPLLDMINRSKAAGQSVGKAGAMGDKIAGDQGLAVRAKKCGWGNDVKGYKASGYKCPKPKSAGAGATAMPTLDPNSVKMIQQKLGLPADGKMGPNTQQGMQNYMKQNKLANLNQVVAKLTGKA